MRKSDRRQTSGRRRVERSDYCPKCGYMLKVESASEGLELLVWTVQEHRRLAKDKGEEPSPADEWLYSALVLIGAEEDGDE